MICYNLLLSLSPVCVEDSADQHAAVCSLPDLIHEPGRLDNGGQAPPYRRCVCKDQARTMGKLVGHFFLFLLVLLYFYVWSFAFFLGFFSQFGIFWYFSFLAGGSCMLPPPFSL